MSSHDIFTQVLHEWTGIFMRRSTIDFMHTMKEFGLSMPQLATMIRLYFADTCGVSDLGNYVGVSNAAASQMVDRLVQQGLLDRNEDPCDRRNKIIRLTLKGQELVQKSLEARHRWMEDLTIALTPDEQDSITKALTLLTQVARQLEKQPA
jgi:DNA-binding MarR family transcriptional regulator